MAQSIRRLLMVLIGAALLVIYVGAAVVAYQLLRLLLTQPPDAASAFLAVSVVTVLSALLSYRFGTQQLLAGVDAVEIGPQNAPRLFTRLYALSEEMGVQPPRVFVGQLGAPNAFALGGVRSGTLVIDMSLFRLLSAAEREAILAHELAHLENYDAFVQTLAYTVMRTLVGLLMIPLFPLLLVVIGTARAMAWIRGRPNEWDRSPLLLVYDWASIGITILAIAVTLLIRAHSRRREYAADDRAVTVTNNPLALARALQKIQRATDREHSMLSTLYVRGDENGTLTNLLSTHPPMDERIERLLQQSDSRTQHIRIREGR